MPVGKCPFKSKIKNLWQLTKQAAKGLPLGITNGKLRKTCICAHTRLNSTHHKTGARLLMRYFFC